MACLLMQVRMSTMEARVASDHRGRRKQPGLLRQVAAAWRRRRHGEPGHSSGSMFVPARHASANVSVPAVDFSEWLLRSVQPQDHLVLHMDIAGAEFEVQVPAHASDLYCSSALTVAPPLTCPCRSSQSP